MGCDDLKQHFRGLKYMYNYVHLCKLRKQVYSNSPRLTFLNSSALYSASFLILKNSEWSHIKLTDV